MEDLKLTITVTDDANGIDPEELAEAIEAEIDDALTRIENRYGVKAERRTDG